MIAELPSYTDDDAVPPALRAAALDAFFIHLRALIEFLITKPAPGKPLAISRWNYAQGLQLDNALRDRLKAASAFANTHVAHFNAERVPDADSPITQTPSRAALAGYVEDVFTAMEVFARHLVNAGSVHAADFDGFLKEAQRRAALETGPG